jgi:DNA mismatch repair ATPase MutS
MKIYRIASPETDIKDINKDIRDLQKDVKDFKKDRKDIDKVIKKIEEIEKIIKELNLGNRLFYQTNSIFTSLQRKIEKFEIVQNEWKNFKEEIDDKVKKIVEKKTRNL